MKISSLWVTVRPPLCWQKGFTMFEKENYTMVLEEGLFYDKSKVWAVRDGSGKLVKSFYQKAAAARLLASLEETENKLFNQHQRGILAPDLRESGQN